MYQSLQACGIAEGGLSGGLCQEGVSGKRAKQTFQPVRWDTGVWFPRIAHGKPWELVGLRPCRATPPSSSDPPASEGVRSPMASK